jgi:hypothetical protein
MGEAHIAFAGEQIISLVLIDADTHREVQVLTSGSNLNLATLPKNVDIRATTSPSVVGSVVFILSGTHNRRQVESHAPYEVFGLDAWIPIAGNYTLTATPYSSINGGGTAGTAKTITFTISRPQPLQVNFQDPTTLPPRGWLRDYGQPYGMRTGSNQGSNQMYGWKKRSDSSPLDISLGGTTPGNGRNRGMIADTLLNTLMHMQGNNVEGNFNGTKAEGYWEAKVPNGMYDVTVSAGDPGVFYTPESHSLTVEGVKAITSFKPSGVQGSTTRFKNATVRVSVRDGHLTILADGGFNTKINSARIAPVFTGPYTYWSANAQELKVEKGSTGTATTFSLDLSNSLNATDLQYALSAVYSSGATGWLSFNASHAGTEPNVIFNYQAARNLAVGTYTATVTAAAPGFSGGKVAIKVEVTAPQPYVISSTPANGATNVSINTSSIAANNLYIPALTGYQGGVDNATITNGTVKLMKMGTTPSQVMGVVQGTGGGDAISFSPSFALEANTIYKFIVTSGVKSYSGASFKPYEATFTTGASLATGDPMAVEFTKVAVPGTQHKKYTSLAIGPDGKLYALRLDATVERFTINRTNGTTSGQQFITTLSSKYGKRYAVGLTFDPASTATNPIVYISHSSGWDNAPEFDGKISRLSGANLEREQLIITNLPRSIRDHLVNSIAFGPDGAMYFSQGSNSSMGSQDATWLRGESLLSAAVLRLDMKKLATVALPLDVKTTANQGVINSASATSMRMSDGTYNPYSSASPLTIYASGIRNAYDLVWHSNGQLYVAANGSAAGGNSPASAAGTRRPNGTFYNGAAVPATTGVKVQNDFLFRVNPLKPVGYYGHPNPLRGEYVVNRGYADNPIYPITIGADQNYRGSAFNFELNRSPNGSLEYKSNAFGGALKGKLLVCRFSGGGDIIVLKPGSTIPAPSVTSAISDDRIYDITQAHTGAGTSGMVGMSGFLNPLDVVEDVATGNLYVSEYNWNNSTMSPSQITLLRASELSDADGFASAYPSAISATELVGDPTVTSYAVTVANTGRGNLNVKGIEITGADAAQFEMIGAPKANPHKPLKIAKNTSITFNVAFKPTSKGHKKASLRVVSNKKKQDQVVTVELNGLGVVYEESYTELKNDSAAAAGAGRKATEEVEGRKADRHIVSVYPNPNTPGSKIYIRLHGFGKQEPVTIALHHASGQIVQARTVVTDADGRADTEMPITKGMRAGVYILQAQAQSGNKQTKLVIE